MHEEIFRLESWINKHEAILAGFLCTNQAAKASRIASMLTDARKALAIIRVKVNTMLQK